MIVEKAQDQKLNEYMASHKGPDVLDAIKKGDRLIRGSTLELFNCKIILKAARYWGPASVAGLGKAIDEEDIDEIAPMGIDLDYDAE